MSRINAIRGMNDILPEATARWQQLENTLRGLMQRYGYHEIRLPVVEPTPLFNVSLASGAGGVTIGLRQQYDVAADGTRFLVNMEASASPAAIAKDRVA